MEVSVKVRDDQEPGLACIALVEMWVVLLCLTTNVGHVLALTTLMMSSSGEYYSGKI